MPAAAAAAGAVDNQEEEGSHSGSDRDQMAAEAARKPQIAGFLEARLRGWLTRG